MLYTEHSSVNRFDYVNLAVAPLSGSGALSKRESGDGDRADAMRPTDAVPRRVHDPGVQLVAQR